MFKIGIVTDSTADMPESFYRENDISVVPLYVRIGEETYRDWVDLTPDRFYGKLRAATVLPKTSQPSVEDFAGVYRRFEGYDGILSVHLSSRLSGTVESARIAAESAPCQVMVLDGKQASIGTGFILQAAVEARQRGLTLPETALNAAAAAQKLKIAFCVDTMKYLEMGGRIGRAKSLAASLLKIKPVLTLADGEVVPYKTFKSQARVLQEISAFVAVQGAVRPLRVGYVHADCPERVDQLREAVGASGVKVASETVSEMGAVIGTYIGPGGYAVVVLPV